MGDPYQRLRGEIEEYISEELSSIREDAPGDSPIETLFYTALWAYCRFGGCVTPNLVAPTKYHGIDQLLSAEHPWTLIIEPQAQLDSWRVDFLIYAWEFGRLSGKAQYRRLIVECDGYNFHERTKEQSAKDRGRDREFQLRGYTILRFTGSELYANPLACARQVGEWIEMGW